MTKPRTIALLAASGLAVALAASRAASPDQPPPMIRPVLSVIATAHTSDTIGPFVGTVEPRYSAAVAFKVFGRLVARDADVGDLVRKGARLASLDPAVQVIAVRTAEAAVANAEAQLANATATEARQRVLLERKVTSPAQFELDQKNRETAAANLVQAKANLTKAQEDLADTQMYADFDGVVIARNAEVGQVLSAGQTVVTVARPDVKEAVFDVPDALATALEANASFDVVLQLDPTVTATGRVREIAPEADPTTRTRRVRLALDHPPDAFRLGTTITVSRAIAVAPRIDLPATALLERSGKSFVWIVDKRTKAVELREVTLSSRKETTMTVTQGLAAGDRVVIAGVHSLLPGQVVRVPDEATR